MKYDRIIISSPNKKPCGLGMWFRVFKSKAMTYRCIELLLFEGGASYKCHIDIVVSPDETNHIEGDVSCQRLISLFLACTDKDVD
jgi:hypothetical protein